MIEPDITRVGHSLSSHELTAVGGDVESVAGARAVRWHVPHHVLTDGPKTLHFE